MRRAGATVVATTFAALPAGGLVVRVSFDHPVPAPDRRFPPTDERPLDVRLRAYRVERTETVLEVRTVVVDRCTSIRAARSGAPAG